MKRNIHPWILVVLWMVLIFYFSHQPVTQSNGLSTGITEKIIAMVEKIAPNMKINIRSFNHIIRKNTHLFAYLILGVLISNGLRSGEVEDNIGFIIASIISVLYAISDEVHQLFVLGRSGQVNDIIIDSIGSLLGTALYYKSRIFNFIKA